MSTVEQFAIIVPCVLVGCLLYLILLEVGCLRWGWMEKFEAFMGWIEAVAHKVARR